MVVLPMLAPAAVELVASMPLVAASIIHIVVMVDIKPIQDIRLHTPLQHKQQRVLMELPLLIGMVVSASVVVELIIAVATAEPVAAAGTVVPVHVPMVPLMMIEAAAAAPDMFIQLLQPATIQAAACSTAISIFPMHVPSQVITRLKLLQVEPKQATKATDTQG